MPLFKKKNKNPPLFDLLDEKYERTKMHNDTCFYYVLRDEQVPIAREWCRRRLVYMDIDHKTYDNVFYKFVV